MDLRGLEHPSFEADLCGANSEARGGSDGDGGENEKEKKEREDATRSTVSIEGSKIYDVLRF